MLKPLILMEIILVLLICLILVAALLYKQRTLLKKMHSKFIDMQTQQQMTDSVDAYFIRSIEETLQRYQKQTNSNTIVFDTSRPYSEKILALRYLYLNVEKDAEDRKKTTKIGWNFYEDRFELLLGLIHKHQEQHKLLDVSPELKEYKTESKLVIGKLKDIIASLQHNIHEAPALIPGQEYKEILNSIISTDNLEKIRQLFDEMKLFSDKFEPKKDNHIERSINTLGYEVESSDKSITTLRSSSDQGVSVNLREVNKLKDSNKIQRCIISNLEKEISMLRGSIDINASQEDREIKEKEIFRLERVVKEYEGCVIILEDQINNLYVRLEEKSKSLPVQTESQQDLQALHKELENVSKRMDSVANDYRQAVALNRSIYAFGQCKTIKDIANHIVKLIREFNLPAGFSIQSTVGKADYFPPLLFNDALKKMVKTSSPKEHISQLNSNMLFSSYGIKMIIFPSADAVDSINTTISGLVCVASEIVRRLENNYTLKKTSVNIDGWVSLAKNKIANIDIQFSYQTEENKKIYNQFINDFKQAYHLLELAGEGATLLENALTEYEMRMHVLLSNGDVIDKELTKFIQHINALKLQTPQPSE